MTMQDNRYDHQAIEEKWRTVWREEKLDQVDMTGTNAQGKPFGSAQGKPFYNLMMFPYPSAEGLHVGNMYAFTGSDIYGRFKRMQGYNVFEPIGLDGFGIHSENYALKIGRHPMDHAKVTEKNFYNQLQKIGAMFDWSRTVETYDPDYYRWTQWIFVQMFKHGLAYRDKAEVNWCPSCKTVLADEQVIEGKCERCGNIVEKRLLNQWFFRITAYAEKLLENLAGSARGGINLDWSEKVKVAQYNWIGKKEGITIVYPAVDESGNNVGEIDCFTTRPDTNFGATFVVIAPEHPFVTSMLSTSASLLRASLLKDVRSSEPVKLPEKKRIEIAAYVKEHAGVSEADRIAQGRKKTGVFTGFYCVNQLNNYKMPLYISDFVVMGFGTGAVVGVPGHDERDFEFAKAFDIPVIRVAIGKDGDSSPIVAIEQVQEEEGTMINSDLLNGMDIYEAKTKIMDYLEEKGWGKRMATYHLRDWLISRQRYWGPPIPMIYCEKCAKEGKSWFSEHRTQNTMTKKDKLSSGIWDLSSPASMAGWYPVLEDQLPVVLPRIEDYKPGNDGVAPLAKHKDFFNVACPQCGAAARRETDVSDTFLDSSWYFLKYPSTHSASADRLPWDPEITKKWLPVSMYTGGAEHSVLHLMYSRFVWKCFYDWGYFDFSGEAGSRFAGEEPFTRFFAHGLVIKDGAKMSKSKGNVVNPDEYIALYGTDSLRLYLMFMGPFDQGGDFRDTAMEGMSRWVKRVWRIAMQSIAKFNQSDQSDQSEIKKVLHKLIKKVTEDIERRHYNTAIAAMMEFTNFVEDNGGVMKKEDLATFLKLLAPFAPYVAEEVYQRIMNYAMPAGRQDLRITNEEKNQKNRKSYFVNHKSIHLQPWPTYDPRQLEEGTVEILVQVNGKLRDKLSIDAQQSQDQSAIETLARASEKIQKFLDRGKAKNVIFVPGRLINFVV